MLGFYPVASAPVAGFAQDIVAASITVSMAAVEAGADIASINIELGSAMWGDVAEGTEIWTDATLGAEIWTEVA